MIEFPNRTINDITLGNRAITNISLGNISVWPTTSADASISPTYISVGSGSTAVTLYITDNSNHGWRINSGGWANPYYYTGTGTTSLPLNITTNTQSVQRSTTLTFTDLTSSAQTTLQVVQAAAEAASSVTFLINPGSLTIGYYNAYELNWTLSWDRDMIDVIDSNTIAQPMYYGDVIDWGNTDYSEVVPRSEYGTTKRVYYEIVLLDDNGDYLTNYTGSAEVTIPSNPSAAQQYIYLDLPAL